MTNEIRAFLTAYRAGVANLGPFGFVWTPVLLWMLIGNRFTWGRWSTDPDNE